MTGQLPFPARLSDPDTSQAAAALDRTTAREQILALIARRRGYGATRNEAAATLGMERSTVSSRISQLHHAGRLVDSGERRDGCAVWVAS